MKIAVFGGTFDPPHIGHFQIAQALIGQELVDEVWFVPVWEHPLGKSIRHTEARLEMLRLLIKNQLRMKLNLFEIEKGGVSYTYQTMCAFHEQFPEHEFVFVIGSDNLVHFSKWYEYQKLATEFPILVYPRAGFPLEPLIGQMAALTNVPIVETSSTEVRERAQKGQAIERLVTPEIAQYIKSNSLYVT